MGAYKEPDIFRSVSRRPLTHRSTLAWARESGTRLGIPPINSPISRLTNALSRLTLYAVTKPDPVLIAYAVKRYAEDKPAVWTRIGAAWPHEQGAGLTVLLDALPRDGRIILLEPNEDDDARLEREAQRAREPTPSS